MLDILTWWPSHSSHRNDLTKGGKKVTQLLSGRARGRKQLCLLLRDLKPIVMGLPQW